MKIYTLKRTQFLPISITMAWDFFSSPRNLSKITPAHMKFIILSISGGEEMYPGKLIHYRVNVIPAFPVTWLTEITQVSIPHYFVDEQRSGPYAFWHHQHHFKTVSGGVEMSDEVNYGLPMGILGKIANRLFVQRKVNAIFDHRSKTLLEVFGNVGMEITHPAQP